MPKYSIIIPAHNSEAFIHKALKSVKDQVFKDYELIVVCDRCNDFTAGIAGYYADKIIETDWGNDGSRQSGIDVAEGEFVLFMDDDDHWLHEYVITQIDEAIGYHASDILMFGFIFKTIGYAPPVRPGGGIWPAVWNKCYRREFIKDIRFNSIVPTPDGNAADIDWTRRVIAQNPTFKILNMPLLYYNYLRPGSQTVTKVKIGGVDDS